MPKNYKSRPRLYGKDARFCRYCDNNVGLIRKYDLLMCRRCFREHANTIGFVKTR